MLTFLRGLRGLLFLSIAKIEEALEQQDAKFEEFKKNLPAKPQKRGLLVFARKERWEK